jgi:hypothetical protein
MTGRLPEDSLKMPGQVCLVGEPGRQRDLGQRPPVALRGDQSPGVAQPATGLGIDGACSPPPNVPFRLNSPGLKIEPLPNTPSV